MHSCYLSLFHHRHMLPAMMEYFLYFLYIMTLFLQTYILINTQSISMMMMVKNKFYSDIHTCHAQFKSQTWQIWHSLQSNEHFFSLFALISILFMKISLEYCDRRFPSSLFSFTKSKILISIHFITFSWQTKWPSIEMSKQGF